MSRMDRDTRMARLDVITSHCDMIRLCDTMIEVAKKNGHAVTLTHMMVARRKYQKMLLEMGSVKVQVAQINREANASPTMIRRKKCGGGCKKCTKCASKH